jgi:hypothetical protein
MIQGKVFAAESLCPHSPEMWCCHWPLKGKYTRQRKRAVNDYGYLVFMNRNRNSLGS